MGAIAEISILQFQSQLSFWLFLVCRTHVIVRAQNELALRKWRVQQEGQDVETDALVASWRDELMRLRGTKEAIVT